jgi:hypothetical protein
MEQNLPENFVTICKIAGLSPEKIGKTWEDIQKKILEGFFKWLSQDGGLTDEQKKKLLEIMGNEAKITEAGGVWEAMAPLLSDEQLPVAADKMAEAMLDNLEAFYNSLRQIMTFEQRQVADAYIKNEYGRAATTA